MATARAVAKVNDAALKSFLAEKGPTKILGEIAFDIRDKAIAIAPDKTGYYKRRFQVRPWRTIWRVENVDPFAHLVEWGSVNNRAYAPIRGAIAQVGGKAVGGKP